MNSDSKNLSEVLKSIQMRQSLLTHNRGGQPMKTMDPAKKAALIKQAHKHLDIVEREIKHMFAIIKERQKRKAA